MTNQDMRSNQPQRPQMDSLLLATDNEERMAEFERIAERVFEQPLAIHKISSSDKEYQMDDQEREFRNDGKYGLVQIRITQPKATLAWGLSQGVPVAVADAGLYIDSLGGRPGPIVKDNMDKGQLGRNLLDWMCKGAHRYGEPTFTWVEGIAVKLSEEKEVLVSGMVSGRISKEPSKIKGFGFDDIMIVEPEMQLERGLCTSLEDARILTELMHEHGATIKDEFSARAVAFARVGQELGLALTGVGESLLRQHQSMSFTAADL